MLGIGEEISIFLQALLSGSMVFLTYCCIRIIRRLIRHSLFFISLEDMLFWMGSGLYLFVEIYQTSDGSIRWFFVIGAISGGMIACGLVKALKIMCEKFHKKMIDK